jgi:hypothetical protein
MDFSEYQLQNKQQTKIISNKKAMKKYLKQTLAAALLTGILFSCKKESTAVTKDYSASVKDKTWWGQLTYTAKTQEYYSVHFNADNTLLWSQLSGDYAGKWVVKDNILTMTFDVNIADIKATISDDNKLTSITDNTGYYEINTGEMSTNETIQLDNTLWKGPINLVASKTLQLIFKPGFTVEPKHDNITVGTGSYSYKIPAGNGSIRVTINTGYVFAVITANNEMKGSWLKSDYPFTVTKQ